MKTPIIRQPASTVGKLMVAGVVFVLALAAGRTQAVTASNFTITNHATLQPLSLYNYQGSIILLDFWAYWCGPCQAASADIEPNITQYYRNAGGNPNGVPVQVISINIDNSSLSSENSFINAYGLELVGDDNGSAWSQYSMGYIPHFAVINGTTNSVNYASWEILYSNYGYSQATLKSFIDAVQTPAPVPSVTYPPNGAVFPATNMTLRASLNTKGKIIKRVEFYTGSTLLGSTTNSPYSITWSNVTAGAKTVFARAYYGTSSSADSTAVSFTLGNTASVRFTASPTNGAPLTVVQFTCPNLDSTSNRITGWRWDFGDGGGSALQNPTHTYTNNGLYNPTLTATNTLATLVVGSGSQITVTNCFAYSVQNSAATITEYTGSGGAVQIPPQLGGLPVVAIDTFAFSSASQIDTVTMPQGITSIGDYAFYSCTNLTSIFIPASTTNLGQSVFTLCTSLTNLSVDPLSSTYSSLGGVLYDKSCTKLINYPAGLKGKYTMPNFVTSIGDRAFFNCAGLTNVVLSTNLTAIGRYAFYGCSSLLTSTLPDKITSIGTYAFARCAGLSALTLPNNLTNLGSHAFDSCSGLTRVFFKGNAPASDATVFASATNALVFYVPGATNWGATFGGAPARFWNPKFECDAAGFGKRGNGFQLTISGTPDIPIVMETCTNLAGNVWTALHCTNLTAGCLCVTHSNCASQRTLYYRIRAP